MYNAYLHVHIKDVAYLILEWKIYRMKDTYYFKINWYWKSKWCLLMKCKYFLYYSFHWAFVLDFWMDLLLLYGCLMLIFCNFQSMFFLGTQLPSFVSGILLCLFFCDMKQWQAHLPMFSILEIFTIWFKYFFTQINERFYTNLSVYYWLYIIYLT